TTPFIFLFMLNLVCILVAFFVYLNSVTSTSEKLSLSLHDALPISSPHRLVLRRAHRQPDRARDYPARARSPRPLEYASVPPRGRVLLRRTAAGLPPNHRRGRR